MTGTRALLSLSLASTFACGGGTADVTVSFEHRVNGAALTTGPGTPYVNAAGNAFGVELVRYFVCHVSLDYEGGETFIVPGAHFVDHDDESTVSYALGDEAPAGVLSALSFVMGLPPELNVTGEFPTRPESLMEWPEMMGGGYHHMKLEGRYVDDASEISNFRLHAGPTLGEDYSFVVRIPVEDRVVDGEATLTLQMNLEQWLTDPEDWDLNDYFNDTKPGIMDDPVAQSSLRANGATVFSLGAP